MLKYMSRHQSGEAHGFAQRWRAMLSVLALNVIPFIILLADARFG
jgi:hypothetical protein